MLKLLSAIFFLSFSVAPIKTYAILGQTETQVRQNHEDAQEIDEDTINSLHLVVFKHARGFFCVGFLNGKSAVETFIFNEDVQLTKDDVFTQLKDYSDQWHEIPSATDNTRSFLSDDGEVLAVVGEIDTGKLHASKTVTVFSKQFRDYVEHIHKL